MCYTLLNRDASNLAAGLWPFGPNIVSRSAGAMRKANVLCKSLSTVESLGAVNVIASDKTGTLTQNKMSVSDAVTANARYSAADVHDVIRQRKPDMHALDTLGAIAALCNDAVFDAGYVERKVLPEDRKVNGDATGNVDALVSLSHPLFILCCRHGPFKIRG